MLKKKNVKDYGSGLAPDQYHGSPDIIIVCNTRTKQEEIYDQIGCMSVFGASAKDWLSQRTRPWSQKFGVQFQLLSTFEIVQNSCTST